MKRELRLFIDDILESIKLAEEYIKNYSIRDLEESQQLQDSIVRRLEIIGEAVKNIPESFRKKYPGIDWKKIAGFRDIIIPSYFKIDIDIVWEIINNDLPKLRKKVQKIKEDLEKEAEKVKN